MQDLAGTALRRVHLAAHLPRSMLASQRACLAARSARDASISRMPNKWWVFVHPQASDTTLNAVILH